MTRTDRDKRLALAISLGFHVLVFSTLAMSGVFTFLQQKTETRPIDVTVYQQDGADDGNVHSSAPAGDSAASRGSSSAMPTYTVPQQKALPDINEAYTNAAQEARTVAAVMTARHTEKTVGPAAASRTSAGTGKNTIHNTDVGKGDTESPGGTGDDTGSGQGNSTGNGNDTSHGNGNGGSDTTAPSTDTPGRRPAKNAHAIYKPDPGAYYPEGLRRNNSTAVVVVQFTVTADGAVTDVSVVTSSGYPDADDAAMRLVSAYRYNPAENEYGQPVAAQGTQTVRFSLE